MVVGSHQGYNTCQTTCSPGIYHLDWKSRVDRGRVVAELAVKVITPAPDRATRVTVQRPSYHNWNRSEDRRTGGLRTMLVVPVAVIVYYMNAVPPGADCRCRVNESALRRPGSVKRQIDRILDFHPRSRRSSGIRRSPQLHPVQPRSADIRDRAGNRNRSAHG